MGEQIFEPPIVIAFMAVAFILGAAMSFWGND